MADFYDTLTNFRQLGSDLNRAASSGSGGISPQYWDPVGNNSAHCPGWPLIDMTIHQGDVYVAWIELEDDAGTLKARGPYCSVWNGSGWDNVGGELEASLTPMRPYDSGSGVNSRSYHSPSIWDPGTRFVPARIHLASDGTSLYCGYSIHVTEQNPFEMAYNWDARKAVIQVWDGVSWSLLYEQDAECNTSAGVWSDGSTTPAASYYFLYDVAASPAEPDVVYIATYEMGPEGITGDYSFGPPMLRRQTFTRIASGVPSTTVVLSTTDTPFISSGSVPGHPCWFPCAVTPSGGTAQPSGRRLAIRNDTGTPYIFGYWLTQDFNPSSAFTWTMRELLTSVDLQTVTVADGYTYGMPTDFPLFHGHKAYSAARERYYFNADDGDGHAELCEMPSDGSSLHVPVDGVPILAVIDSVTTGAVGQPVVEEPDNIWGLLVNAAELYHRPCRALDAFPPEIELFSLGGDTITVSGSETGNADQSIVLEQNEDTVFIAGIFNDDSPLYNRVRVYGYDIDRDALSCASPVPASIRHTFGLGQ